MKTFSAGLKAHHQQECTSLSKCWKVVRRDSTVYGFTDNDRDLPVEGVSYKARTGFSRTAIQANAELSVDNLDLEGIFDSESITEIDLRAGLWDYASVDIFTVNWADLSQGIGDRVRGRLGNVREGRNRFIAELRSLTQHLQQQVGRTFLAACDEDYGGPRCKVRLDPPVWQATTAYTVRPSGDAGLGSVVKPTTFNRRHFRCSQAGTSGGTEPTWNGTVGGTTVDGTAEWITERAKTVTGSLTGVTGNDAFTDTSCTEPDDFFTEGKIRFDSGPNIGLARDVKRSLATGVITVQTPFPFTVAVGHQYTMTAGCRKRKTEDCKNVNDNVYNHQGFDELSGTDQMISGGL